MAEQVPRRGQSLPRKRGTQIGLSNPGQVDAIKADMLLGQYAYQEERGQITGVLDPKGTYHVKTGHHRMAAALELYKETGDPTAVFELLHWGLWVKVDHPPIDSCPFPARSWWGALRNWLNL
jgi:filamentous hemagglutinin